MPEKPDKNDPSETDPKISSIWNLYFDSILPYCLVAGVFGTLLYGSNEGMRRVGARLCAMRRFRISDRSIEKTTGITMTQSGQVVFSKQDEVIFGRPASEAAADVADRFGVKRIFLMVSGTLRRDTDEIDKLCAALGDRCVGIFDTMPQHSPRSAIVNATEQARDLKPDLIMTLGGGSITDGAKGVQICLANDYRTVEAMDGMLPTPGADGTPSLKRRVNKNRSSSCPPSFRR